MERRVRTTSSSFTVTGAKPGAIKTALRALVEGELRGEIALTDMRSVGLQFSVELQVAQGEVFDWEHVETAPVERARAEQVEVDG